MLRVLQLIKKLIHINTLSVLYYLLIMISSISQAVTHQLCQKQSDCNDGESIHCGICSDNESPGIGKCYFPFPYMFQDSVKCLKKTVCDDNCNQHGNCSSDLEQFYYADWIPNCFCDDKFYGRTCNKSIPQDLVGRILLFISVSFWGIQLPSEKTKHNFYVSCKDHIPGSIGMKEVECDDGRYYDVREVQTLYCASYPILKYLFETIFQYKNYNNEVNQKFLTLGNTILGYLSTCRLKFTMEGAINFEQNLGVFVTYTNNSLICVPVIELYGCAPTNIYNAKYTRLNHIRISSFVYYIADGSYISTSVRKMECKENANYIWTIWKNKHHEEGGTFAQYVEKEELFFDPMSLQPGFYRVLLEVNVVQEMPSKNYAYCYFQITTIPLVAIIDEGSERTVSKNVGLILSTSRSCDPNEPLDKQDHVHASWSCVEISNHNRNEICDPLKSLPVSNSYHVPSEKLCFSCKYNITLKVWTNYYGRISTAFANAIITVGNGTEKQITIHCLLNCKEKVIHDQRLYLRAKSEGVTNKQIYQYTWHYYERGQGRENDTKSIAIEGLPSFMLIVKEHSFSSGKSYVIVVRTINNKGVAKYWFDTQQIEFDGNCSITPNSGITGLSLFQIVCQNFHNSFTFEFYDKTYEEAQSSLIYNGRMLGTAKNTGMYELKDFRVTRGQVFVYIIDNSGIYTYIQFSVNLTRWNMSEKEVSQIFTNLTELFSQGVGEKMLRYMSCITDILPSTVDKHNVLNKLLNYIRLAPVKTLADIKLTTSTLTNVLTSLNKPVQLALDSMLVRDTLRTLKTLTYLFSVIVGKGLDLNGMSPQEIRLVTTGQLNCLYAALMCKDPRTVEVTEFSCDLKTLDELMDISTYSEDIIYLIKDVLTFLQAPAEPPTKIALTGNSYVVWVIENDEEYNLTNYLSQYNNDVPIDVSNEFIKEFGTDLRKNKEELTLRVAIFDENIFWWPKSDVKSNLVSVSLAKHSKRENLGRIRFVENPVNIKIGLNSGLCSTKVMDSAKPYYLGGKCSLDLDLGIKIHRLDPIPQSLVLLRFLFPQTNGSLLVHVHRDYRPDCEMMMKNAITVTDKSPNYPPFLSSQHKPTFFFIGILPKNNQSVTYTFEVNTTVCQFWAGGHWSSQGCKIDKNKSMNLKAHCACNHFSVFSAAFPVPPQELDPFSDISLFFTVFENPYVVSFVLIVLAIYFICCFWARLKDKSDRSLRNVIILDDNFPKDRHPYLLTVYTSSRFNAGTTAHVGLQIEGSSASSRPHILACKKRKVLKRNFDDWFLIKCLDPLGDLESIHLWHDNSGSSPDWFCDKIIVYDLNNNTETVFVIEQWIALRLTYFPEAIVRSASDSQVKSVKRIFLDNCILGLREGHTLLCIILRHPRSETSRLQRISILMCCLMSSMLCSIMFYSPQVDDQEFSVGLRDFYISVQSLVIMLVITFLIFFTFRRSYKYSKAKITLENRENEDGNVSSRKIGREKSLYKNFVRYVLKTLKGHPLVPAQLEHSEPVVLVRNSWLFIAWVLCVSVILTCSFFVMLYGLKLGPVKSKLWLSSVLFVLSEDFFIATPAKIILCSVILSLAFQQMSDTSKHIVNLRDVLGMKVENNEENIQKLLIRRRHPMYAPVRSGLVYKMLEKKELWSNWWTFIDFTVALCFIFVVSIVVFKMWSSHYYTSCQVKNIATESHHPSMGSEHFFGIKTMFQINNYLQSSVFQQFYNTFFYNEMAIEETDIDRHNWAEDFTHSMVGLLRYRQIRVKSVECRYKLINITRKCIPHYENRNEDTESYSLRWKPAQWQDVERTNSPWKYTERSTSTFFTIYRLSGKSGTIFHNGGYLTDLGQTWSTSKAKAYEVVSNKWQDQLTRAVFVEVTMYNINVDLFSQLTVIVEYLISGKIQLKAQVISVESKMKLSFWNALLIAFVIYYIFRSGYLINRQGLVEYLSTSSRNRSRLLVVLLGTLSILIAAIHYVSSIAYYNSFINSGSKDTYFDFDTFIYYFLQLKIILSCLLCVAIFRTVLIFRGGRTVLNYFYTFTISLNRILWLTMVISIFLIVEILLVILLNNVSPVYSIQEIVISSKFTNFFEMHSVDNGPFIIIFYIKSMSFNAFMGFYVVIFKHYYKIAQTYKIKKSDKFNLIIFFFTNLKKKKWSV